MAYFTTFAATGNTSLPEDMTLRGTNSLDTKATTSAHSGADVPTDASISSAADTVESVDPARKKVLLSKAALATFVDLAMAERYIALLVKIGGSDAIRVRLLEVSRERLGGNPADFYRRFVVRARIARVQEMRRLASTKCVSQVQLQAANWL